MNIANGALFFVLGADVFADKAVHVKSARVALFRRRGMHSVSFGVDATMTLLPCKSGVDKGTGETNDMIRIEITAPNESNNIQDRVSLSRMRSSSVRLIFCTGASLIPESRDARDRSP